MSIKTLRDANPFPADVDKANQTLAPLGLPMGWACREMVTAIIKYARYAKAVIDGGSFQGLSATHFIKQTRATVICIDHWRGSDEHQGREDIHRLYQIFLANMAPHAKRVIPIRKTSISGLMEVKYHNVKPECILVDWAHDEESVFGDVKCALELFPKAVLIIDDWRRPAVRAGVKKAVNGKRKIDAWEKIAIVCK